MSQALHILRKDIRYLWIEIAAALLAIALFLFTATHPTLVWNSPLPRTVASFLMQFLMPFAWWTLITRAIHAEPLIGDRQFWPTRPYAWRSLLAAKGLLFLLFINLPVLIAQIIVIELHGFSAFAELPGLIWSQLLLTGFVLLPIATIASVTVSVVQFLVIGLVCFIAVMVLSMRFMLVAAAMVGGGWGPMEWIHTYYGLLVIVVASPAILMWQYAKRQTLWVRCLTAAAVVVLILGAPISWTTAFALQSHLSPHPVNTSTMHVSANGDFLWMIRALVERDGRVSIHVPLQIGGVADDMTVVPLGVEVAIQGAGGDAWSAPARVSATGQLISLQTTVDGSFYQKVKDQPARIHGYLYATLYGNRRVIKLPFNNRVQHVPGMGLCAASTKKDAPYLLNCSSAFRPQTDLVSVRFEERSPRGSINFIPSSEPPTYSPFPAQFGVDPISPYTAYSTYKEPLDAVTITTQEPLAHVKIPVAIEGLKLGEYERKL